MTASTDGPLDHRPIVRQVAIVVLFLAAVDLINNVLLFSRGETQFSLNFALYVAFGILLFRSGPGSVRMARVAAGVGVALTLFFPVLGLSAENSFELALLQIRVDPLWKAWEAILWLTSLVTFVGAMLQLSRREVSDFLHAYGKASPNAFAGLGFGSLAVVALLVVVQLSFHSADAQKAIQAALAKVPSVEKFSGDWDNPSR